MKSLCSIYIFFLQKLMHNAKCTTSDETLCKCESAPNFLSSHISVPSLHLKNVYVLLYDTQRINIRYLIRSNDLSDRNIRYTNICYIYSGGAFILCACPLIKLIIYKLQFEVTILLRLAIVHKFIKSKNWWKMIKFCLT